MKIEIRKRGEVLAALDDNGNPIRAELGKVKNYGRGNQVYLPKGWEDSTVIVVDVTEFD
jgi:hypothetical protein